MTDICKNVERKRSRKPTLLAGRLLLHGPLKYENTPGRDGRIHVHTHTYIHHDGSCPDQPPALWIVLYFCFCLLLSSSSPCLGASESEKVLLSTLRHCIIFSFGIGFGSQQRANRQHHYACKRSPWSSFDRQLGRTMLSAGSGSGSGCHLNSNAAHFWPTWRQSLRLPFPAPPIPSIPASRISARRGPHANISACQWSLKHSVLKALDIGWESSPTLGLFAPWLLRPHRLCVSRSGSSASMRSYPAPSYPNYSQLPMSAAGAGTATDEKSLALPNLGYSPEFGQHLFTSLCSPLSLSLDI